MSSIVVEVRTVRETSERTLGVGPACSRRRAAHDTPLRLTQRGRVALILAVLALAYGVMAMLSAPAASTGQVRHVPTHTVVVTAGETLWDIAKSVAPRSDPRPVVAEIVDLNSLSDPGSIRAGQPLDVPAQ